MRHASNSCGPAARWMAPSTPPPPSNVVFAALTMASTGRVTMSTCLASSWLGITPVSSLKFEVPSSNDPTLVQLQTWNLELQTVPYQPPDCSHFSTCSRRSDPQNGSPSITMYGEPNTPRSMAASTSVLSRSLTAGSFSARVSSSLSTPSLAATLPVTSGLEISRSSAK